MPRIISEDDQRFIILDGNETRTVPKEGLTPFQMDELNAMPRAPGIMGQGPGPGLGPAGTQPGASPGVSGQIAPVELSPSGPPTPAAPPVSTPVIPVTGAFGAEPAQQQPPMPGLAPIPRGPRGPQEQVLPMARGVNPPPGTVHLGPGERPTPRQSRATEKFYAELKGKGKGPGKGPRFAGGFRKSMRELDDIQAEMKEAQETGAENTRAQLEKMESQETKRKAEIEAQIGQLQEMEDDIINQKIDPNHFWSKDSDAKNVGFAIAMLAHSIGNQMQGGDPGNTMRLVNGMIDRDIDAQKAELAKKKNLLGSKRNSLGLMQARFRDDRSAEDAQRSVMATGLAQQLGVLSDRAGNIQKKQALINAKNQLIQYAQSRKDEIWYKQQTLGIQRYQAETQRAKVAGAAGAKQLSQPTVEKITNIDASIKDIDRLEAEFMDKTGWASIFNQFVPGSDAKEYKLSAQAAIVAMVKNISGAQVSEKELERIKNLYPKPGTWDSDGKVMFRALREMVTQKRNQYVSGLGASGYDVGAFQQLQSQEQQSQSTIPGEKRY